MKKKTYLKDFLTWDSCPFLNDVPAKVYLRTDKDAFIELMGLIHISKFFFKPNH